MVAWGRTRKLEPQTFPTSVCLHRLVETRITVCSYTQWLEERLDGLVDSTARAIVFADQAMASGVNDEYRQYCDVMLDTYPEVATQIAQYE